MSQEEGQRHNIVRMQTPPQISEGLRRAITNGRTVTIIEVFLRIEGSKPHIRLPSPRVLHQENKTPKTSHLKTIRIIFKRTREL